MQVLPYQFEESTGLGFPFSPGVTYVIIPPFSEPGGGPSDKAKHHAIVSTPASSQSYDHGASRVR